MDFRLSLREDGRYDREFDGVSDQGQWQLDEAEKAISFHSADPEHSDAYWIMQLHGAENASTLLILCLARIVSRNLPILFYRVHL